MGEWKVLIEELKEELQNYEEREIEKKQILKRLQELRNEYIEIGTKKENVLQNIENISENDYKKLNNRQQGI